MVIRCLFTCISAVNRVSTSHVIVLELTVVLKLA